MRIMIIAAIAAVGFGFVGMSGVSAAPATGSAIRDTAAASSLRQNVRDEDRDHHKRHCYVRHGHRHCD